MRGRYGIGSPVYEPTPQERERERDGHVRFLEENRRELKEVEDKLANIKDIFKAENHKLFDYLEKKVLKAKKLEDEWSAKHDSINTLEKQLKEKIKEVSGIKARSEKKVERVENELLRREAEVNKQRDINNTDRRELTRKLALVDEALSSARSKESSSTELLNSLVDKKNKLVKDKKDLDKAKLEVRTELAVKRELNKALKDKSSKLDHLIQANEKLRIKLSKESAIAESLRKKLNDRLRRE